MCLRFLQVKNTDQNNALNRVGDLRLNCSELGMEAGEEIQRYQFLRTPPRITQIIAAMKWGGAEGCGSEPCQSIELCEICPSEEILISVKSAGFHLGYSSTNHVCLTGEYSHAFKVAIRRAAGAEQS